MKRNVIKQGVNSYTVTLPSDWVKENNITQGTELEIKEEDNDLVVSLITRKSPSTKVTIDLKEYSYRSLKCIIFQLYRKGYDEITCIIKDPEKKDALKEIVRKNLLGFEIINEKETKLVIENVAEPSKEKFSSIMNRLFFIINTNAKEIIEDLKNNDFSKLEKHKETKEMFDLYSNFLRRLIIKNKIGGSKDMSFLFYFVSQMSYTQHGVYYGFENCAKNKKKVDKEIILFIEYYINIANLLHEIFFSKNIKKNDQIGVYFDQYLKEIIEYMDNPRKKSKGAAYHILSGIRSAFLGSTIIFGSNNGENEI